MRVDEEKAALRARLNELVAVNTSVCLRRNMIAIDETQLTV